MDSIISWIILTIIGIAGGVLLVSKVDKELSRKTEEEEKDYWD